MIVNIDGDIDPLIPMISLTTNTDLVTNLASPLFRKYSVKVIIRNTQRGTWIYVKQEYAVCTREQTIW